MDDCKKYKEQIELLKKENKLLLELVKKYKYDQLTGLPRKQDYEEDIDKVYLESRMHNRDLYFTLIDIKGLHNYNIVHGYDKGDEYIKGIVNTLKDKIIHGKLYRIGGDEFALITNYDPSYILENIDNINYFTILVDGSIPVKDLITTAHKHIKKYEENRL